MKKYDLHKIMKAAHEIYRKYFKLYQLTHGVQTFGDCLKLAWANEKKRVADEEASPLCVFVATFLRSKTNLIVGYFIFF